MTAFDPNIYTPYSSLLPLLGTNDIAEWTPELDKERISSYQKYDELYWSHPTAFKLEMRGDEGNPIYVPNPRQICDSTAHFLMKGMTVTTDGTPEMVAALNAFLVREEFYAKFHTNKLSGVTRGDYVFHMVADPNKPEGSRISIKDIDPASYFPITDPLDPDRITGVRIVDQIIGDDNQVQIKIQLYTYTDTHKVESSTTVWKLAYWWDGRRGQQVKVLDPPHILPDAITTIPVFHIKNIDWQGQDFGSSELRGYERLMASVNQSVTDEELALALDGLGVYATDGGHPVDEETNEPVDWTMGPGTVIEKGYGSSFDRINGVGSVRPMQDHIKYLTDALYESAATFRPGVIDVAVAQSGIALAIRFLPTLAKSEQRELVGLNAVKQLFFNWKNWSDIYEKTNFRDTEIIVTLGDKLPLDPIQRLNELNNMLDRNVISRQYYRDEMAKMGYIFPDGMETQILDELKKIQQVIAPPVPVVGPNGQPFKPPNNTGKPNESKGTEAPKLK